MNQRRNRKLLVSVFNPQEAREAVLGGGRIVDSEDPRSALGNIKPRQIMTISDAVLNYKRDLEVQLSTNIGEDQLLFDRSERGQAIEKSPYEIAGKAAQSAIGVACAMGTRVHPCNLVKVGVDGMNGELVKEVLDEVVLTLNRTEQFSHCQVMSVLFAQDMEFWNKRKDERAVRDVLIELREFHPCSREDEDAFDLQDYAVNTLRDRQGNILFSNLKRVSLDALIAKDVLPDDSVDTYVKLNELFPHNTYFPEIARGQKRTNKDVIKAMVDVTADAGADAIMLDTRIQTKISRICLVDTASDGLIDINRFDIKDGIPRHGILSLDEIRFFVEYCHYRGIEANVAGSVQSYQAQQLWVKIPELDQVSTRGGASAVNLKPDAETQAADTRQHRVIKRILVRGLAPPEQGGVLNLPISMKKSQEAMCSIKVICKELVEERCKQGLPDLECFFVDRYGVATPFECSTLDQGGSGE
jgi:uncharacterized protein (UPF0264 family)